MKRYDIYMKCDSCGAEIDMRDPVNLCPKCGGLLEVVYDLQAMRRDGTSYITDKTCNTMWKYRGMMPTVSDENIVSLGEGNTPLIKSKYLGPSLGIENLYFKNDTMMPTGSFKDRGYSLAISFAKEIGIRRGFTYSSGNAGTSFAAYSARAGIKALIIVEYLSNEVKRSLMTLYGPKVVIVKHNNFGEVLDMIEYGVKELGLYQFVNFINPIRHEAMKVYAYEIYDELSFVPDYMFHPMGTGGGVYGTWKGFRELAELGVTDKIPHMVAVQPDAVCWLKHAINKNADEGELYGDCAATIAQSICGNYPVQGGKRLLKCIRETNGIAASVSDDEMLCAMRDLAHEGIAAEPSSASSVAAFKQAVKAGKINSDESAVCVITGFALKQPSAILKAADQPHEEIFATREALKSVVDKYYD